MKKTISVLLSFMLAVLCFIPYHSTAFAADEYTTEDGLYKYKYYDNTKSSIAISRYLGEEEAVYVPSEIEGKPVVSTSYQCFYMNQYIKEIHFPASLTTLHSETFYACIACENYYVDENNPVYRSIDGVIYDKTGTKLCFCPENYQTETFVVKDDVVEIGINAFRYHQIYYPKQIYTAPKIKHIVFPEGLKRIMGGAFDGSYIQEFILPDSLTDDGTNFLASATQYKKLHIGANMGTKYVSGFNCYYLQEISVSPENEYFTVENNVLFNKEKDKLYCFPSGRAETTYRIPDGVKTVASYSFNSTRLKNIDFNEVEVIESQTFGQDLSMKSLVFPKSVKSAKTIANFFQPGITSITILNPECDFSFPFNFGSGWVNYTVTIYGFNGSTAEAFVKNNTLSNLTLTFSALHTSDTEYDIYSGVHDYKGVVTEPTCTEQGYTHYTCSVCGIEYNDQYTDALGHNFLPYAIIAPTCEEQGYTIYKCSRCELTTHLDFTEPTGHSFTVAEKDEPTCTENGYIKYKCVLCKKTTDEILPSGGHNYSLIHKVEPTCTTSGYTDYICISCGNSYSTGYTEPLGHSLTVIEKSEPTCADNGYIKYQCVLCKKTTEDILPSNGHNYSIIHKVEPTCTASGYTEYVCISCGNSYSTGYTEPLGHSLTVTEKSEPTCTENGYKKYKCVLCKKTTEEIIPSRGHNYSVLKKVEPTCTTSGYTEYGCSVCGNTYSSDHVEPLGHTYSAKITPATFVKNGKETMVCSKCNYVQSSKPLYKIGQVKLKNNSFIYSGKKINGLTIVINDSNSKRIASSEYDLKIYSRANGKEISSPTKIGQYKATVLLKNHYSGKKDLYFFIKPKTPTVSKLTAGKGKIKIAIKKDRSVSRCQVIVSENKKFTKNVKTYSVNASGKTKTIRLKRKKKYYIKIRSYKIVTVDGKKTKMFSEYTKVKTIKTK